MERRQIELAGAAWYLNALVNGAEKIGFPHRLQHPIVQTVQSVGSLAYFQQDAVQRIQVDARRLPQTIQSRDISVQLLQQLALNFIPSDQIQDIEQSSQRLTAVPGRRSFNGVTDLLKQQFQPQQGTNAFVKRLFVTDGLGHNSPCGLGLIIGSG